MDGHDHHKRLPERVGWRRPRSDRKWGARKLQKSSGQSLNTNSTPRTADRPAEHLIAVVFERPEFIEVAFARFRMLDGSGHSIVYSHRMYGEKIGDKMNEWLKAHGKETEDALMKWDSAPSPRSISGKMP